MFQDKEVCACIWYKDGENEMSGKLGCSLESLRVFTVFSQCFFTVSLWMLILVSVVRPSAVKGQ